MKEIARWSTGSRRGYIPVKLRGVESNIKPIPDTLNGLRGNYRKAMRYLGAVGCTHYATAEWQGVPNVGYSNQYCYTTYYGYIDK